MKVDTHLTFYVRGRDRTQLFGQVRDKIKSAGFDPDEANIVLRIEPETLSGTWLGEADVYVQSYSD